MNTHLFVAIICTRGRGSFCCTLLACQSIKKQDDFSRHHQGSQIVCTHLCVDASQRGRDKEGGLSSVTYYIFPFSQHCLLSHRELMFICSRLRLRCEMCHTCWCMLYISASSVLQPNNRVLLKLHEQFQSECHTSVIKRENKGIFGVLCHRCWGILQKNSFSSFLCL